MLRSELQGPPERETLPEIKIGRTPDRAGTAEAALLRVASLRENLRQIEEAALRTRDLVRAMRVHARPASPDAPRAPDGTGAGARLPLQSTGRA